MRMVRTRRWKYVWNATAEDELYDLGKDPAEIHNLATDVGHSDILKQLRRRLVEWMRDVGDELLNPWPDTHLREGLTV